MMIKRICLLFLILCTACQSIKIKNDTYQLATSSPELGSIGFASKKNVIQNIFEVRALPHLENKIRISAEILPFNQKLNKAYYSKAKYNQHQSALHYADSLEVKPELVTLKIIDVHGLVQELNASYNKTVMQLLRDTQDLKIVTSLAINASPEYLAKIQQADTYYLVKTQESKYAISLYTAGQKTAQLILQPQDIIAYRSSSFCWAQNAKKEWYLADINGGGATCLGTTQTAIPSKKQTNKSLFDL
jgi:hypothetical protein